MDALLCTTSYDTLSCFLSRLISECSLPAKVVDVKIGSAATSFEEVLSEHEMSHSDVLLIFCGHGTEDSLLSGTQQDCWNLTGQLEEGTFYDSTSFDAGPSLLAAICCEAGSELGRMFAQITGGGFFGYLDKLSFIITDREEYNSWWRKILCHIIDKIIVDQKISHETVDFAKSLYEEAHSYFCSGDGRFEEKALGMRMCLRRNILALCQY